MNGIATLHCLIYSHNWCVHRLESTPLIGKRTLLVELAQESHLAPVFRQHGQPQGGLAPLLAPPLQRRWFGRWGLANGPHERLEAVLGASIHMWPGLSVPLVLAADPPLSKAALESAVALLSETPSGFEQIVLLIHISDVPWLITPYQYAQRFSVMWDIADLPSAALPRMAEVLARSHCLAPERWGGFHLSSHPSRLPADLTARHEIWRTLLAEFPAVGGTTGAA